MEPIFEYLLRDPEKDGGFVITKFVKGSDRSPKSLAKQFERNETYRKIKRKNNVVLYMDILSFHQSDGYISNEILQRITKKYLSLRAPLSIALATVHRHEKSHTHLHICYGIEYRTGISVRISKNNFQNKIKLPMEQFQREQFPELKYSEIDHTNSKKKEQ
ncbi:relaxase/mobilization nuclease domain-containing protein [Gilvibacter sediminis]|uniref:relaxase/mobilization nuclease domain-containing protein n=1 Tax=Gilvibacter sediminis TaxID=379071 RepID=UPI00234FDDA2|nr:hypothetical protein [Gilvibacter sediminis]MDC7996914.1 hypothetical protein [Gilvibacter sediminis]